MSQGAFLLMILLKTYTAVRTNSKTNTIEQLLVHEILIYTYLNNKHQEKITLISFMLSFSKFTFRNQSAENNLCINILNRQVKEDSYCNDTKGMTEKAHLYPNR